MIDKVYKCSWCKKKLTGHPYSFDYRSYTGSYRGYQSKYHFYFCTECFNEIIKFIKDKGITYEKVVKMKK